MALENVNDLSEVKKEVKKNCVVTSNFFFWNGSPQEGFFETTDKEMLGVTKDYAIDYLRLKVEYERLQKQQDTWIKEKIASASNKGSKSKETSELVSEEVNSVEIIKLRQQLIDANAEIENTKDENRKLSDSCVKLDINNSKLQTLIDERNETIESLQDTIKELKEQLERKKVVRQSYTKARLERDSDIVAMSVKGVKAKKIMEQYPEYDRAIVFRALQATRDTDKDRLIQIYNSYPEKFVGVSYDDFKIWLANRVDKASIYRTNKLTKKEAE